MRIPYSKVYRAFPEFDRFGDAQCEAYLRYLRNSPRTNYSSVRVMLVFLAIVAVVASPIVALYGATFLVRIVAPGMFKSANGDVYWLASMGGALLVCFSASALVILTIRDLVIRRAIREQLKGVRCDHCGYSLLGVRVLEGVVLCPECGDKFTIALRGLREEDFRVEAEELPGLDEVAVPRGVPAKPYEHVMDPGEKERMLEAIRDRRANLKP
jgi:uncharacterized Zn finger protein (UPF0148 family)